MCLFATTLREREVFGSLQSATRLALPGPFPTTVGRRLVPEVWFVQKKGRGLRLETLGRNAQPQPPQRLCAQISYPHDPQTSRFGMEGTLRRWTGWLGQQALRSLVPHRP